MNERQEPASNGSNSSVPHTRDRSRVRLWDIIILTFVVTGIILLTLQTYRDRGSEPILIIRVDDLEWQYTLDEDRTLMIPGPLGQTEVVVHEGRVHVHESPCEAKVCVAAGEISRVGDWIICLPNRVFISIEGILEEQGEVDAVVY